MNKIIFPLTLQMQGEGVANPQEALRLCLSQRTILTNEETIRNELLDLLKQENAEQIYGNATSKLVSIFQKELELQSNGEVDEPTATALNKALQGGGVPLLNWNTNNQLYTITNKSGGCKCFK